MEKPPEKSCKNVAAIIKDGGSRNGAADLLCSTHVAIDELHLKELTALKTHNVDMFTGLMTEDCIMLPPALKPLCGRESIRSYLEDKFSEWKAYEISGYDQHFDEVRVIGNIAYEWGTSRGAYYLKNGGPDIFENSRIFRILRSQPDGSWKIARAIWHDVP